MKNIIFITFLIALVGCAKNKPEFEELGIASVSATLPPPPAASSVALKLEAAPYHYPFWQDRDPFIPLVGNGGSGGAYSGEDSEFSGNTSSLELKGIIKDRRGKIALLSTAGKDSYVLRAGRIYDRRNRAIQGATGIIREESVLITFANKSTKELKIRQFNGSDK